MTTSFITRHPGTIEWAKNENILTENVTLCATFDPETVQPGDLVIGTLPAQLAARICERGGRYQHLTLDLPETLRGQELGLEQMRACNARLEEFYIQRSSVRNSPTETTIQICLASGESLPNIIPAITEEFKAGRLLILASQYMQSAATRLKYGLEVAGIPSSQIQIKSDFPDHNLANIITHAQQLASEISANNPGVRLILNLTGGTKPMATGLMQAFRPSAEIIYCDTEHSRIEYFHPIGKPPVKLAVNLLKRDSYLAAQGYKLRPDTTDTSGITQRAPITQALVNAAPKIERLVGQLNKAAYNYREGKLHLAALDTPNSASEKSIIEPLLAAGLLKAPNSHSLSIANETAAIYLGGGWLEEWCWIIGKALETGEPGKRLHANRWGINLKIDPFEQAQIPGRNHYALNELDAVFVHQNCLLLIECKSGVQISDRGESQDILNKLETLGKHVGGRLDTKWILTARNIDRNEHAIQRAKLYGIRIIKPSELANLQALILQWMQS